jgi:hypothetical protein
MPAVQPSSQGAMPAAEPAGSPEPAPQPVPPPPSAPDPAQVVARFPPPPAQIWEFPGYAVRVLLRQLELRQELETLRKRRSPDVALYERALKAHDAKTFATGLAITCAGLAVLTFLFFLPVILRFLRSPD